LSAARTQQDAAAQIRIRHCGPVSSSNKILIGLCAGAFVGIFLGEHAGVFKFAADGFVKLLQMTVLPYITLSIVTSLGTLNFAQVKIIGLAVGRCSSVCGVSLWFLPF
jgi:Na+/H+-dicarboxylate symporter